jgi:hypothetical protein
MALRDTLKKMEETEKDSAVIVQTKLKQWRQEAIPELFKRIQALLLDLIKDGLITVGPKRTESRTEEKTGPYNVEVLDLVIRGRTITFSPLALFVFGSDGRVDLFTRGRLDQRYLLLRTRDDTKAKDIWGIVSEKERQESRRRALPQGIPELSRSTLEDAVEKLLKV